MKIGVLSDTHLRRVTKELEEIYDKYLADKDLVLHAGDIVSTEVVDFLDRKTFYGVHGNMDPVEVKEVLPARRIIDLGPLRIGLIHGGGSADGLEERVITQFHDVDVVVYGHSHIPANHVKDGVLMFNPGTATGFTYSGVHTIGVLDVNDVVRGEIIRL